MTEKRTRKRDADIDWLTIEARFRAGASAREIGREFDLPHTRITRRAARFGWLQDPNGIKRERVKAALLGDPATAKTDELLDEAVNQDVEDMSRGLRNARLILQRIGDHLENGVYAGTKTTADGVEVEIRVPPSPKDLRTLGGANLAAVESVRRIRDLDDPDAAGPILNKEERDAIVRAAYSPEG